MDSFSHCSTRFLCPGPIFCVERWPWHILPLLLAITFGCEASWQQGNVARFALTFRVVAASIAIRECYKSI